MIHSKNVNQSTLEKFKDVGAIEIEFDMYDLSEQIRVNKIFKDWEIGKPEYKSQTFSRIFKHKIK